MSKFAAGDRVWLIVGMDGKMRTPWRGKVVDTLFDFDGTYFVRREDGGSCFYYARVRDGDLYATEREARDDYYRRLVTRSDEAKVVLDGLRDEMRREADRRLREDIGDPIRECEVAARGWRDVVRTLQTWLRLAEDRDGELTARIDHDRVLQEQLLESYRRLIALWREGITEVPLQEESS